VCEAFFRHCYVILKNLIPCRDLNPGIVQMKLLVVREWRDRRSEGPREAVGLTPARAGRRGHGRGQVRARPRRRPRSRGHAAPLHAVFQLLQRRLQHVRHLLRVQLLRCQLFVYVYIRMNFCHLGDSLLWVDVFKITEVHLNFWVTFFKGKTPMNEFL
jgi:hypothetical protein